MAELPVEVAGMGEWGFFVLGQIPDAEGRLGRIPRDDFANGFPDLLPLASEVSANNFGGGLCEVVAGQSEVKMEPLPVATAFLLQKPSNRLKVSPSREPLGEVSHQEMELFQPILLITLKLTLETQMPVNHPTWHSVKRCEDCIVHVLITKVSCFLSHDFLKAAFKGSVPLASNPPQRYEVHTSAADELWCCHGDK